MRDIQKILQTIKEMTQTEIEMNIHDQLICALNSYKESDFKQGGQYVLYIIGMYLLNAFSKEHISQESLTIEKDIRLVRNRDFCNEINQEFGKIIIYPQELGSFIKRNREYFAGAYHQNNKGAPIFVNKEKMLEKLKNFTKTETNIKENISEYLKMREQKSCTQNVQQSKFIDLDKHIGI